MRTLLALSAAALGGLWFWRKGLETTSSTSAPRGDTKTAKTLLLEAGATLLQGKSPLQAMKLYLDGFHFYADDLGRQIEAHHYCAAINEDFYQCVIFDGNTSEARLIGIEYIISPRLYRLLPEAEKRLWHSHHYEVKSGTLIAPGLPQWVEDELMKKIVTTYGKTWHTWDIERDELPIGVPALMMAFTDDGQLQPALVEDRDRRFRVSTAERRERRRAIPRPPLAPGCNAWEDGVTVRLALESAAVKGIEHVPGP